MHDDYGIGGYATHYACQRLAQKTIDGTIRTYNAQAIILKLYDADGNPEATHLADNHSPRNSLTSN